MNLPFLLSAISAIALGAASIFAQTIPDVPALRHYTFESISVPLPLSLTFATGINNRGAVVGYYYSKGQQFGFKRDANGVFEFPILGATNMQAAAAAGINDSGEIAGYSYDGLKFLGFLLSGGVHGTYSKIDAGQALGIPVRVDTHITGLNNLGDFVGNICCNSAGFDQSHGFANIAGVFTIIDEGLNELAVAFPQAIAWDGTIVGCYRPLEQNQRGFLRGPKGNFLTFEVAGGDDTCATGVNNESHTIVGTFHGADFRFHSFIYDYKADLAASLQDSDPYIRIIRPQTLEFPGVGIGTTTLSGVNAKGVVVGSFVPNEGYTFSFIATPK